MTEWIGDEGNIFQLYSILFLQLKDPQDSYNEQLQYDNCSFFGYLVNVKSSLYLLILLHYLIC